MNDAALSDLEPQADAALETLPAVEPEATTEAKCPHCGAPARGESWCRFCGFVPRLGTFVEPDAPEPVAETPPSWREVIPRWVWILAGAQLAVVLVSLAGRLLTEPDSTARMSWALAQWGLGTVVFWVAHFRAYLFAIMENAQLGVLDLVIKPLAIWGPTVKALPGSLRLVLCGSCSFTGGLCGPLLIGGIPYAAIWEIGPRAQARQNLVQAITSQAAKAQGTARNLQEAVKGFAGEGNGEGMERAKPVAPPPARTIECLIVGYRPLDESDFSELLLAADVDQQLRIVGALTAGIPDEVRDELNRALRTSHRETPFVRTNVTGMIWVEPRWACRVRYRDWTSSRRLERPVFDELLAELRP